MTHLNILRFICSGNYHSVSVHHVSPVGTLNARPNMTHRAFSSSVLWVAHPTKQFESRCDQHGHNSSTSSTTTPPDSKVGIENLSGSSFCPASAWRVLMVFLRFRVLPGPASHYSASFQCGKPRIFHWTHKKLKFLAEGSTATKLLFK